MTSWKVMFLHLSVSHSLHRGVSGTTTPWMLPPVQTPQAYNPPDQTLPSGQTHPGIQPIWEYSTPLNTTTLLFQPPPPPPIPCPHSLQHRLIAGDGSHPIGMLSCFIVVCKILGVQSEYIMCRGVYKLCPCFLSKWIFNIFGFYPI